MLLPDLLHKFGASASLPPAPVFKGEFCGGANNQETELCIRPFSPAFALEILLNPSTPFFLMISEATRAALYSQGYRFVGNHSAVKTCLWCANALRSQGTCYKHRFYGINSWRCVQMTPALGFCNYRCEWCWRDISYAEKEWHGEMDSPKEIVDGCIEEHKKLLTGFKGFEKTDMQRFREAMNPKHFAISLSGEPTLYPELPALIKELDSRNITSFVVSNASQPEMIKKLLETQPTQMYFTLPAPNNETFTTSCHPLEENSWERMMESFAMLKKFNRSVVRLTLTKGVNLESPEEYAELLQKFKPNFIELKGYMALGFSRKRVGPKGMPLHLEVKEFAEKLNNILGYTPADESAPSRVALLWDGKTERMIDFSE